MRKMSIFTLLPFMVAVVLSSCSRQTTDSGVPVCEITAPLDSLFSTIFQDSNDPGGVVIVRLGDSIMYNRSFGLADLEKKTVMTDSTVVNVASASKTYVTAALVKLRDDGHLSLDDKLNKFFPNFTSPVFGEISLRLVCPICGLLPTTNGKHTSKTIVRLSAMGPTIAFTVGRKNSHVFSRLSIR